MITAAAPAATAIPTNRPTMSPSPSACPVLDLLIVATDLHLSAFRTATGAPLRERAGAARTAPRSERTGRLVDGFLGLAGLGALVVDVFLDQAMRAHAVPGDRAGRVGVGRHVPVVAARVPLDVRQEEGVLVVPEALARAPGVALVVQRPVLGLAD